MSGDIEIREFSNEDYQNLYGDRRIEVGKCFKDKNNKYYQQRKDHVLHINIDARLVNILHAGFLNADIVFKEIELKEFENIAKKLIYELELDKFWNK